MKIRLTKAHKKPNGKKIAKGTIISVHEGHPYKDFEVVGKETETTDQKQFKQIKQIKENENE